MNLINADCLEHLKTMDTNSCDSLVTDPPAGIGFMGKDWDSSSGGRTAWTLWLMSIFQECLRVLKPGAHGLVWALPRTSHWTATALEDAGFEIRDSVVHIFGSGFPKSMDVSKQIDKMNGAKREVISSYQQPDIRNNRNADKTEDRIGSNRIDNKVQYQTINITEPSSLEAKQWQGWGTALKPSFEPWLLVTKPFTTVPLDAILKEIDSELRDFICLQLPAKFVQTHSMLSNRDSKEETFASVQWLANISRILKSQELEPKTDISISPEAVTILLSIVTLWNSILDAVLKNQNTCITKMETKLIIELKILKYSILRSTRVSIILEGNMTNGDMSLAKSVQRELLDAYSKLKDLMERFVQENASMQAEDCKMLQENQLEYGQEIKKAGSKNAHENWLLIRKPLSEKTVAANVLEHGTGGLNIDASRIGTSKTDIDGMLRLKGTNIKANNFVGGKGVYTPPPPSQLGRFPANLVLSHHSECEHWQCHEDCAVKGLDDHSGIAKEGKLQIGAKPRSNKGFKLSDTSRDRSDLIVNYGDQGGASRFFYVAKASRKDRGEGNVHPTVKSTKLMEYLIKLITPPNGIVLDPFMGSGSTGVSAKRLGFDFIGIEKEKEYFDIALKRIDG